MIVVLPEVRLIEVFRYPTGTKLTGIVLLHRLGYPVGTSFQRSTESMEELCEDSTLKNLVIVIFPWGKVTSTADAEALLQSDLSDPGGFAQAVVRRGARIYRCTGGSEPDLGALRIILGGRSVVPEVQQEPINKPSKSEQTAVRPVEPNKDKEVEELRRELEEQKGRAQQEADVFKKRIAEMQSKEESIRQEVSQELEEQKRKAQEEADGLRKCITEMQSKLEEDRHVFGKVSAIHSFRHVPARSRVFLMRSLTHLTLQRVYPSTDLHPNSPIVSTTYFTARSMNNVCETFRRMTSSGSLIIWTGYVTVSPLSLAAQAGR